MMLDLLDVTSYQQNYVWKNYVESCLQNLQESTKASIVRGLENNKLWKLKCCNDLTHMQDTQV